MWGKIAKDASMSSFSDKVTFRSVSLNWATHGGIERGRCVNLYGPESSGKSMLAYEAIADDLKNNDKKVALIFDAEANLTTPGQMEYLKSLGVPIKYSIIKNEDGSEGIEIDSDSRVMIQWKNNPDEIFDWTIDKVLPALKEQGLRLSIVLIDSMQAIVPPKEADAAKTTKHVMGDISGYLPKAFRKITLDSRKAGVNWFFVNQARDKLDSMHGGLTYTGGRAARHGYDYVILLDKINSKDSSIYGEDKDIRGNNILIGHRIRAKIEKCRLGSVGRQAEFDIIYGKGHTNATQEIVDLAIKRDIVNQAGAWVSYGDIKGQGTNGFIKAIDDNIVAELRSKILNDVEETVNEDADGEVFEEAKPKKTKKAAS